MARSSGPIPTTRKSSSRRAGSGDPGSPDDLGENRARLVESIETALRFGKDKINFVDLETQRNEVHPFSTGWHCAHCDLDIRPPTPGLFSFNNPLGACPECRGFGRTIAIDLNRAIPDRALSIAQGAVRVFRGEEMGESQKDLLRACAREEIDVDLPFEELPKCDQDFVINGEKRARRIDARRLRERSLVRRARFFPLAGEQDLQNACARPAQPLSRLHHLPELSGRTFSARDAQLSSCSVTSAERRSAFTSAGVRALSDLRRRAMFLTSLTIPPNDSAAEMLRDEIVARLSYLCEVGVGYLTLDRSTRTLSGGEVQRVNLTTCLGASLVNTLFVMDEPSVGLHPRDIGRLVRVMHDLRDKGNTLLVVEHEEAIIRAADQSARYRAGPRRKRRRTGFQRLARRNFGERALAPLAPVAHARIISARRSRRSIPSPYARLPHGANDSVPNRGNRRASRSRARPSTTLRISTSIFR